MSRRGPRSPSTRSRSHHDVGSPQRGFPEPCPDVVSVRPLEGFRLHLRFEDGTEGDVDVAGIVREFTGVFEPVQAADYFRTVRVDRGLGTIRWPNGADIAPETLFVSLSRKTRRAAAATARSPEPPASGSETPVPEICRFFGIVIQMYFREEHAPHFHARYSDRKAAIEIKTLKVLSGRLPPRIQGFIAEWATLHEKELLENWERARLGRKLRRIAPLE